MRRKKDKEEEREKKKEKKKKKKKQQQQRNLSQWRCFEHAMLGCAEVVLKGCMQERCEQSVAAVCLSSVAQLLSGESILPCFVLGKRHRNVLSGSNRLLIAYKMFWKDFMVQKCHNQRKGVHSEQKGVL